VVLCVVLIELVGDDVVGGCDGKKRWEAKSI
jgi:hypothetical protein